MAGVARILSHPFRLAAAGNVVTVEQDSDQADREQIAVLALTIRGERALVAGFGITDPTFAGFQPGELAAGVATYGPPVRITEVIEPRTTETVQEVTVRFE